MGQSSQHCQSTFPDPIHQEHLKPGKKSIGKDKRLRGGVYERLKVGCYKRHETIESM